MTTLDGALLKQKLPAADRLLACDESGRTRRAIEQYLAPLGPAPARGAEAEQLDLRGAPRLSLLLQDNVAFIIERE